MEEFQIQVEGVGFTMAPFLEKGGTCYLVTSNDLDVCFFLLHDEQGSLQICGKGITKRVLEYRDALVKAITVRE